MKAIFCGINSKYIHTNLAIRYLCAYASKHTGGLDLEIFEDTVNSPIDGVLKAILDREPDVLLFSVYIWNVNYIKDLCRLIRQRAPHIVICMGGPEVSHNTEFYLDTGLADFVQRGEGERPAAELLKSIANKTPVPEDLGICYTDDDGKVLSEAYFEPFLDELESPYTEEYLSAIKGRLAYFESSRGCPFSCAFCLSGAHKGVRNFNMEYVKASLLSLWDSGAKTVKFVDRTFNADYRRADEIISFILEHSPHKPKTCFHFEIAADILADSTLKLLSGAPEGLFQVEAGLQSFNPQTLDAVTRKNDTQKVCDNVSKILTCKNVHTHIDLIAGLPHEDFASFRVSFNRAFELGADMLQLGFLKLLYGSVLRQKHKEFGIVFEPDAPYTVIKTDCLSEVEIKKLYDVEDANEKIYNSHRFESSLDYVLKVSKETPFDLFLGFGKQPTMSLDAYTDKLFEYFASRQGVEKSVLRDKMCIDRLSTNNTGILPPSLRVFDDKLGGIARRLDDIPRQKGAKRVVCILYSQNKAVYADYVKNTPPPYQLHYVDI
ncbi:MAG: DUF4080 domain-containing protein [Ruminococcaceae bacterium]|nr:DUF4080 domain-containing protein [Oscillospiraceae bacterium]